MTDTTSTPASASVTAGGWTATVTHAALVHNSETGETRNRWRWEITSTTDAAEWQPVRSWSAVDLSSALDLGDPDPVAALGSFGSFLGAWIEAQAYPQSENRDLFPPDMADNIDDGLDELADEIALVTEGGRA